MNNTNENHLVIGHGAIGSQVASMLADRGCKVSSMARSDRNIADTITYIQADATQVPAEQLQPFSHIAIIVAPNHGVEGYEKCYLPIAEHIASLHADLPNVQRVMFISSTGVYGQHEGQWIDEQTMPDTPENQRQGSKVILQAEQALQNSFGEKVVIIRPSGIYGATRLREIKQAMQSDKPPMSDVAWTNRIMDSDLVTIICNVLQLAQPKPLYLATDYRPVSNYELMAWLAEELQAQPATQANNVQPTGKRIHSNIPLDWLQYPDWQEGYSYILRNTSTINTITN